MSHLQECQLFLEPMLPAQDWCICQQLRACEQRVLDAAREAIAEQKLVPLAKQGRFIITRNTQLWKQRQAWSELGWWDFRTSALAAIDTLKETP